MQIPSLFTKKSKPVLGVDIGSSAVKVLLLEGSVEKPVLKAFGYAALNKGDVSNGVISKTEAVTQAVQRAIDTARIKVKACAIAMPSQAVIMRTLSYPPGLNDRDLEQYVETDAASQLPFPLEEVRLDYCKTGKLLANEDEEVLLVATKRDTSDVRLMVMEHAGLAPAVLDVESLCVQRTVTALSQKLPKKGRGLLVAHYDFGAETMKLTVVRDREVLFDREQAIGGAKLTQDIAKKFALTIEDAERRKRVADLPSEYAQNALKPFLMSTGEAAARLLQMFFTSTPFSRVDHIYISGGCAMLPGMAETMIQYTDSSVETVKLETLLGSGSKTLYKQFERDSSMYSIAFGLALRAFAKS